MSYRGRGRGGYNNNNNNNNNGRNNFQSNYNSGFGNNSQSNTNQHHNNNKFNHNNAHPNSQTVNQFVSNNSVPVEIIGWNGASMEDCVKFISRKCRIVVSNASVDPATGVMKGYVKSMKDADDLCNWSGVKFAGQSLKINKAIGAAAVTSPAGNTTIETITQFLKSRYSPEMKLLNLSAVQQDPTLSSKGFFANISTASKFFPALMKVAKELKIDVESIDLSNNNLNDLSTISTLSTTFPALKNLSLVNNNFTRLKTFETWRNKLNFLRELIIVGNPILNQANPDDIKIELMKSFPRLIIVNGEVLRDEATLYQNLSFPYTEPQQMFFQDEEISGISTNFVANFYNLWDTNRAALLQLYQPESQFSLSVDMSHPHPIDNTQNVDFGYYLPFSRNLTKISASKSRMARVSTGQELILKAFTQLPKSKHDLIAKPNLFAMEAYRFPQLGGILINLHGTFQETAPPDNLEGLNEANQGPHRPRFGHNRNKKVTLSDKSFDRTFVVLPGPNASMIVASDTLIIRSPSGDEAWNREKKQQSPAPATPNAAAMAPHTPTPPPMAAPNQPQPVPGQVAGPTAADLPPDIKAGLNQVQQDILVKVLLETNLNLQYGLMLCQQSNWDYQQCTVNFKNSAASLPREAYAS